jgi:hypothetical protein
MSFKFKKSVLAGMRRKVLAEMANLREQQAQALLIHGDLIAGEAKRQLDMKDLDPGGQIAKKVVVEALSGGEKAEVVVRVEDEAAYEQEVGPEGGFLTVAAETTKGQAAEKMAEYLRLNLGRRAT